MSELELLNLDSPVIRSSREKNNSVVLSLRNEKDKKAAVHSFLKNEDASTASSSSHSSKKTKGSFISKTKTVHVENSSSSDSEYTHSSQGKEKKRQTFFKSNKGNKIRDMEIREDFERIKLQNVQHEQSESAQPKENMDEESSSAGCSSVDVKMRKSVTSATASTYRERIRDRFNLMKEQATLSKHQPRSQSKLKHLISKQSGPKTEDLLKQEEDEVSAAIRRHERAKLRWRQISKLSVENERKNQSECKLFFEDNKNQNSLRETAKDEEEIPASSPDIEKPDLEEPKMSASELLGIKEDWDLVELVSPKAEKNKNKLLWTDHLFYCSSKSVSLEDKIEPGLNLRLKEEEGLYEGNTTKVPSRIKNKMEQRISKTPDGKKWFGKDGNLIPSNCLLKMILTRPLHIEDKKERTTEVMFKPATPANINHQYLDLSVNLNYVLDIDLNLIEFTHHPLFSREHVMSQRLKELFVKYKKRKDGDNLNRITCRLNALRKTRDNLKSIINQSGDNQYLRDKLQKYKKEIREVRELRYLEGQTDREIANKLVATWKDLMKLREEQGYQNTQLKLNIKKVAKDLKEDKIIWDAGVKQEIEEIFEELKAEYELAVTRYQESHKIWFQNHQRKREKKRGSENSMEKFSDTESTNDSESDENELSDEEPKPPKPVALADVKAQVLKNFKESFRQPGEPELEFFLTNTTNLDATVHNDKEGLRRAAVKRCLIFIKLFYNGKEVCRSKTAPLKQNFSVSVSQRFAIRILEWPESLMIEIHEESGVLNRNLLVPGIYLPLPDPFSTVQNSETVKYEFSSKLSVTYNHAAVGSGKQIIPCPKGSDFNNHPVCLYTAGTVSYRAGWAVDNGKILSPPEKYWTKKKKSLPMSLCGFLNSSGVFDVSKLKEWAENANLDPNDPRNSAFFHFIENTKDLEKNTSYFRLSPLAEEFNFCQDRDFDNNIRLELLKLRNTEEPEFKEIKMIPLDQKEIPKEILKDFRRRLSAPLVLTDISSSDLFDGHRAWGIKYLEQVQQNLLKQYRMSRQSKKFQDIITEETIPDVGTLGLTFMRWLRPKRPLRPVRKERKKVTPQNLSGHEINIVVNVVRAFEVPVRKDLETLPGNESFEGFSLVNVRPVVEISFRGKTAKTTAAEGANPTWNQDLNIPVKSKSGCFPPGELQSMKNTLYLHLFDEVVIDLVEECARETNIHQRLEKHWLGSMEIPFSTLYFNSKIEGTFKLYSPPVLLGYEREAHRRHLGATSSQEPSVPQRDATYITLFVTVQPALNPPKPVEIPQEKMESRESSVLKKHLEGWHQEVTNTFQHRKLKTLVLDITGKSVCVTRFIKALPLPPIQLEDKITPEMAARFVAMIPTTAKNSTFPRFFDIWLTCDQTLKFICGDSEDHAILLCSYFLSLGLQAFILLGSGIPHGSTAYVLVKEKGVKKTEHFIWDPTNGQKHNVDDSFCPLQKVYCLINDKNIWANIQVEEIPRRIRFDLTKSADWFPAFRKNITPPTESIQPQVLDYKTTSRQAVDILRDKIEKKLRDNIMKWRHKHRTQWNRYCAVTLRKLLPKLEEAMWTSGERSPHHTSELQPILASYKMCGFPINVAYTGVEAVSEAVKATRVHCNETEGIEFALAVYIHPYPNDVLSVWVYVASLIRRR